jgi:hypothetical protein
VKAVASTLGVARSNLVEQLKRPEGGRRVSVVRCFGTGGALS